MRTVLLRLEGPLQSWGVDSRYDLRATRPEPTKSGVLGLVGAALGRRREEDVSDLAALRFGVRSDGPGRVVRDYHTALGIVTASGTGRPRSVISERYYIADACFLAALEGAPTLVEQIHAALGQPAVALVLGRRSCPPSTPIQVPGGLVDQPLEDALRTWPSVAPPDRRGRAGERIVRVAIECELEDAHQVQADQPVGRAYHERTFQPRGLRVEHIRVPDATSASR